jgi:hypothetical protein
LGVVQRVLPEADLVVEVEAVAGEDKITGIKTELVETTKL